MKPRGKSPAFGIFMKCAIAGERKRPHNRVNNRIPRPGEVWQGHNIRYTAAAEKKDRPVIVLCVDGGDAICYKCTTKQYTANLYQLMDPESAGLNMESFVDVSTRIRVPIKNLTVCWGMLEKEDLEGLNIRV